MSTQHTGVTSFTLKIVAIVGMTANHLAHAGMGMLPVLVSEGLYWLGGVTFPVMAYLLVEGYRHTSSVQRYLGRLLLFALVSQLPYTLLFGWTANVLFTLAIGLVILWAYDALSSRVLFGGVLLAGVVLSLVCDWGVLGPLMVFMFYGYRRRGTKGVLVTMAVPSAAVLIPAVVRLGEAVGGAGANASQVAALATSFESFSDAFRLVGLPMDFANQMVAQTCNLGYGLIGFTLATVLILGYNGQRGRPLKWTFYIYYPAHLLVIWLVKVFLFP